jgi:hypothetical protein
MYEVSPKFDFTSVYEYRMLSERERERAGE